MHDFQTLTYDTFDGGTIARIMLNRPETRNAQNRALLVELDQAFLQAESDDTVRVVILAGAGKMFSSGHDLKENVDNHGHGDRHPTTGLNGGTRQAAEARMLQEWHYFFNNTRRWRDLRKITIASVHGPVYAAGLMLMWACDLIVAADDVTFADVVGTRFGMCGVEYFGHPWEFGPRRTKELLLTGDSIDVDEAYRLGMVSKVFPPADLEERTLEFARRVAKVPTMAALLVKESVNQTVDIQGFTNALQATFSLHQLNHSHWAEVNGDGFPAGKPGVDVPAWRDAAPIRPAVKDAVGAS
jgi:enoyl-CoA hydratase